MKPLNEMTDEEYEFHVVQQFREAHQQIALMIAAGWTEGKISRVTGRSKRHLTLLTNNPMFQELVDQKRRKMAQYEDQWVREQLEEVYNQQRRDAARAALIDTMITERLERDYEEGNFPSYRDMNLMLSESLGRLGYGKTNTVKHEIGFSGELEKAIRRSGVPQLSIPNRQVSGQGLGLGQGQGPGPVIDADPVEAPRLRLVESRARESSPRFASAPGPSFRLRRL
jgi:hypothetical protein